MASPLVIGTNSLATVTETDAFIPKYFNQPGIEAHGLLTESDASSTYEKSYLAMRASDQFDLYLRGLNLLDVRDSTTQRYTFPREGVIPSIIKECVFLQMLHILVFVKFQGELGGIVSKTIGPLQKTVDQKFLRGAGAGISPEAQNLIEVDTSIVAPLSGFNLRTTRS